MIPFEAKNTLNQQKGDENPPTSPTVIRQRRRRRTKKAPLAKWDEAEENDEEEEEEEEEEGGRGKEEETMRRKEGEDEEEEEEEGKVIGRKEEEEKGAEDEFVVRMRAKKWSRELAKPGEGLGHGVKSPSTDRRFEQRISQILESLQQEAESLIRLQQDRQGESEEGRCWKESRLWAK